MKEKRKGNCGILKVFLLTIFKLIFRFIFVNNIRFIYINVYCKVGIFFFLIERNGEFGSIKIGKIKNNNGICSLKCCKASVLCV